MNELAAFVRLGVALLGGLAVGIEREWSAAKSGSTTRFGGVRTFLLLGLASGVSGLLAEEGHPSTALVLLIAAAALPIAAYVVTGLAGSVDATTEIAGVVAVAAGFIAGSGRLSLASAIFAATALVLVEKGRMHAAVERLRSEELEAAARFAVLALVVLPLLPAEPLAALGGLEPRKLWGLVLLFSGLSFAGYVALRAAGPERGLGVAGLLGGVVSSTAVTINFARESRSKEKLSDALAAGALAASSIMPLRVGLLSLVLNREVALALAPAVGAAALLAGGFVYRALRRGESAKTDAAVGQPSNPLRLLAAIQMTALFAVVLFLIGEAQERFGSLGLLAGAAFLGVTDLDALTLSMARMAGGGLAARDAAHALVLGMGVNTLFKTGVALALGSARFRLKVAGGLALYVAVFAAAFVWFV